MWLLHIFIKIKDNKWVIIANMSTFLLFSLDQIKKYIYIYILNLFGNGLNVAHDELSILDKCSCIK